MSDQEEMTATYLKSNTRKERKNKSQIRHSYDQPFVVQIRDVNLTSQT